MRLMLPVPLIRRRLLHTPWGFGSIPRVRNQSSGPGSGRRRNKEQAKGKDGSSTHSTDKGKPSLIEQLFPEETKRYEEQQRKAASREIPRLPLDSTPAFNRRDTVDHDPAPTRSPAAQALYNKMQAGDRGGPMPTVLVLKSASTNLVEEDFRRLIPSGQHLEGWRLEQGDIIKVVPGRDLATLGQQNYYYLLFSSTLSAFAYQGHVTRIHRLVQTHTPSNLASAIPPPPGYMVEGLDAHAAIEAFALIPAGQNLSLRQLQPPLSPLVQSIVKYGGYPALLRRPDRMPYEVRLTLDGPQLAISSIRHILLQVGKHRSLAWSGGDEVVPKVTKWEPRPNINPNDKHSVRAQSFLKAMERSEEEQVAADMARLERKKAGEQKGQEMKRRTPQVVYVVGFHTELAAQRFVAFWHRRPLVWEGESGASEDEGDLPPIANVEMLW